MVRRRFIKPAILVLLLVVMGLWAAYRTMLAVPPNSGPFPNPNGYEDIIEAGKLLPDHEDFKGFQHWETTQLRDCVRTNAAVLTLLRRGLSKECRVKTEYSEQYMAYHVYEGMYTKELQSLLFIEATLAEREGRLNDAVATELDGVHIGYEYMRGGLMIDALIGSAIILAGTRSIESLVPELNAAACKDAAKKLEQLFQKREPIESIREQERTWIRSSANIFERAEGQLKFGALSKALEAAGASEEGLQKRWTEIQTSTLKVASRAYELEKGRSPDAVADLVPEYLSSVPKDALTGKPLPLPPPIAPKASGGK